VDILANSSIRVFIWHASTSKSPSGKPGLTKQGKLDIHVKNGLVSEFNWETPSGTKAKTLKSIDANKQLHDISDWNVALKELGAINPQDAHLVSELANALNDLLPGASLQQSAKW
jgi:hypothetical protein